MRHWDAARRLKTWGGWGGWGASSFLTLLPSVWVNDVSLGPSLQEATLLFTIVAFCLFGPNMAPRAVWPAPQRLPFRAWTSSQCVWCWRTLQVGPGTMVPARPSHGTAVWGPCYKRARTTRRSLHTTSLTPVDPWGPTGAPRWDLWLLCLSCSLWREPTPVRSRRTMCWPDSKLS